MREEQESSLFDWIKKLPSEMAFDSGHTRISDYEVARLRNAYPNLGRALSEAGKYKDLNEVFTRLLTDYEVVATYRDPRYNFGDTEHATKLYVKPKDNIPDLGIQKEAGFVTFTDCLTFAAQCYLSKEEGFGLPNERTMVVTNIDTWLRKGHRVRLYEDRDEKGKIILEAQRRFDHHPVLRVIGGNFVNCLLKLHSNILGEEVLRRAEDSKFMFRRDGNTPMATIEIEL